MANLTNSLIRRLQIKSDQDRFIWDEALRGFGARIRSNGRCAFIVQYRGPKGQRRRVIGRFPEMTADQARREARQWLAASQRGEDFAEQRDADRKAPRVVDLAEEYLAKHAEIHKSPGSVANDRSMLRRLILPRFGGMKVAGVSKRDIQAFHASLGDRRYQANRVLALLSKMFSLAVDWGWRTDNPVMGVKRYSEEKRDNWLRPDQVARLLEALDEHGDQRIADALRLMLLTGARRSEVLNATWSMFDLERGVWTKPSHHTKSKKVEHIPLNDDALAVLGQLKTEAQDLFLFPGRIPGQPVKDPKKAWAAICARAGLEGTRIHDLRHTFVSLLVSSGLSLEIAGKLVGHTQHATTQRYAHLADEALRTATNRLGSLLRDTEPTVVKFNQGRRSRPTS